VDTVTDLQALATGALIGAAMRFQEYGLLITIEELHADEHGNALPSFVLRGVESGERVRVTVEAEP
jgi:hypothetical protein